MTNDVSREKMSIKFRKSEEMLERALKVIPLGSQTFSKSKTQYPYGVSPFFVTHGRGSKVWDVDGNEFTDFVSSLGAINLGYCDPDVDAAVKEQLGKGTIFTLPHPLETEVAEKLREMVSCAEMTRFGKNGSDATAGAVRIARAHTKRDHILVCGYHGWQDWYIGSTARNLGVPVAVRELTHNFAYNDIDTLENLFSRYEDGVAAVIMEPMNAVEPKDDFLFKVRDLAHRHKALFVLDETITGFRFANGGAQEYFKIEPDLATFGKGMANGYPLSAVTGKAEIMRLMEEIFFSFTFGGETLSLAAAKATMTKLQKNPVVSQIMKQGTSLLENVGRLMEKHGMHDILSLSGHPAWSFLTFKDVSKYSLWETKTLFFQEVYDRGVLTLGTHMLNYSHGDKDIEKITSVYDDVFGILADAVKKGTLEKQLRASPLKPLFKVR